MKRDAIASLFSLVPSGTPARSAKQATTRYAGGE